MSLEEKIDALIGKLPDGFMKRQFERYGVQEVYAKGISTPLGVASYYVTLTLSDNDRVIAGSVGGGVTSIVETLVYYGVGYRRRKSEDMMRAQEEGREYGVLKDTVVPMLGEFGPAEIIDTFVGRPLCAGIAQSLNDIASSWLLEGVRNSALVNVAKGTLSLASTLVSQVVADIGYYAWPVLYREYIRR